MKSIVDQTIAEPAQTTRKTRNEMAAALPSCGHKLRVNHAAAVIPRIAMSRRIASFRRSCLCTRTGLRSSNDWWPCNTGTKREHRPNMWATSRMRRYRGCSTLQHS